MTPVQSHPDRHMMEPVGKIMRFMETRDVSALEGVFVEEGAVLIDSFFPYVFEGPGAVSRWAEGFIRHAGNLSGLRHALGPVREFSQNGDTAFFSQPVTWTGTGAAGAFSEEGGLALSLVLRDGNWRVRAYGWAVTKYESG